MSKVTDRPRAGSHLAAVRTYNKHLRHPSTATLGEGRHWYPAALHHTGRRSGREYVTPIVADPVSGGFVIPLPHGTSADWLRNVLVAGQAIIELQGRRFQVGDPQVFAADAALPMVSSWHRRAWRIANIDRFLFVRTTPGHDA